MKTQPPAESLSKLSITTYFLTFKLSFSKEKAIFSLYFLKIILFIYLFIFDYAGSSLPDVLFFSYGEGALLQL